MIQDSRDKKGNPIYDSRGKIREFTDLKAWQEAHRFAVAVYTETKKFPREEIFGLTSQLRRASVSVSSNIAEGFGRQGYKEKVQFYYLAQGSLTECKSQLLLARDVGYLESSGFEALFDQASSAHQLLQGLLKKSKELSAKRTIHES
jgi:four helix bundle protein